MATTSMTTIAKYSSIVIYDTAAATPIQGVDANTSVIARGASLIQVDTIAAGTTAVVQCKTVYGAEWATVKSIDDTNTPIVIDVSNANFTQLVRTGVDVFKAYAQGG